MGSQTVSGSSVGLAVALVIVAVATWSWHADVVRSRPAEVPKEPWDRVTTAYPISDDSLAAKAAAFSSEMLDAMVQANPFSPKRRLGALPSGGGTDGAGPSGPAQAAIPHFTYKGRVQLGNRQRAIMEETVTGKTYFLEVGQEVAGFKVLDIAENRVVLSDPQTNKEVVVSLVSRSAP